MQAYACAQQIVQAYCKENGNFSQSENASWPLLSSEIEAKLPDMTSIPAPDIQVREFHSNIDSKIVLHIFSHFLAYSRCAKHIA